ncbi:MAG TPA: dienelactone hydrolase family protein [Candidatus Acidoferrales bacterium]|nr:dienelactone hydrolase family protein [Candidatus Acidoferrales bacterium]
MSKTTKLHVACAAMAAAAMFFLLTPRAECAKTEVVHYQVGKETVDGFLASPDKPGRYPGLIVIHDWWGLTDWVKQQTVKFADAGFVALAVDLYNGKVATTPDEAQQLSSSLSDDPVVLQLMGSIVYLTTQNNVEHDRIGAVGWAMGGYYAVDLAMHVPRLGACVDNYGTLPTDPNEIEGIGAPFLGNFGADDRGVAPTDVDAFKKTMTNLNRVVDIKVYDGAGHSFANPADASAYRADAAADAWNRTVAFLNKSLK